MKDAKGHGSNARGAAGAVPAPAYEGKPTWHGVTSSGQKVGNSYGPIAYASPEAAEAGAAHQEGVAQVGQPMTQDRWNAMTPAQRDAARDNSDLTPQLKGLEGHRVEATTNYGETRRFIVGKSTGWKPIHLEVARRTSSGGGGAEKSYASVRDLGKVR